MKSRGISLLTYVVVSLVGAVLCTRAGEEMPIGTAFAAILIPLLIGTSEGRQCLRATWKEWRSR